MQISEVLGCVVMVYALGFTVSSARGHTYYVHSASPEYKAARGVPIILLHGIGAGIVPYIFMVSLWCTTPTPEFV